MTRQIAENRRAFLKMAGAAVLAATGLTTAVSAGNRRDSLRVVDAGEAWNPSEQLHSYFKGRESTNDNLVEIRGVPQAIIEKNGKVAIQFFDQASNKRIDVDPLAIRSEIFAEHPADKTLRLKQELGLSLDPAFEAKLRDPNKREDLCHNISFQHIWGELSHGVVTEISVDGSFITTILGPLPMEWTNTPGQNIYPERFAVYPAHMVSNEEYTSVLNESGYSFDPSIFGLTLKDKVRGLMDWGYYSGEVGKGSIHSNNWQDEQLRKIGAIPPNSGQAFNYHEVDGDSYFTAITRNPDGSWGDTTLYKIAGSANPVPVLTSDVSLLMARINPQNKNQFICCSAAYPEEHPLFQSMWVWDVSTGEKKIIRHPGISNFGRDELLAYEARYTGDGDLVYQRYGDRGPSDIGPNGEGGGEWFLNLHNPNFALDESENGKRYMYLVDHMLERVYVDREAVEGYPHATPTPQATPAPTATPSFVEQSRVLFPVIARSFPSADFVWTDKRELENQNMTVGAAIFDANSKTIYGPRTFGIMGGWNPIIRYVMRDKHGTLHIFPEVPFNYESRQDDYPNAIYHVRS